MSEAKHTIDTGEQRHPIQKIFKRLLDLFISLVGLSILFIPFVIISLWIKLESKGPVFFLQERVGQNSKLFNVLKFRTMVDDAVNQGLGVTVEEGDARITAIGHVLRNWGIDELPQLINVLIGNMSVVGPRPTLFYQVEQYNDFQKKRLLMKPGITSLAVVEGRNSLSWEKRIELDVLYVEQWAFWLDINILFKTLWVVLITHKGVYADDGANDDFGASSKKD